MRRTSTSLLVSVLVGGAAVALAATSASAAGPTSAAAASVADHATVYLIQGVDDTTMTFGLDGKQVRAQAAAKTIVGPLRLSPGSHTVTGAPGSGAPVAATIQVKAGSSTDVVLHRQVDPTKPPAFTTYPNDLTPVTAGSGRLTVAHTAAVGPADIRVNGKVLFSNVANGEELTLTVPGGTYPVDIVPTAATSPVVLGPVDLPVAKGALTRVFAIGVAATGSMDAVVQVLPVATRGAGSAVSSVEAGGGGQAQELIAARRASPPQPSLSVALWPVLAAAGLVAASRRARRSS